jgi:hypothetical protein
MLHKIAMSLSLGTLLATAAVAQPPLPPRPSPLAKVEQSVGVSKITVTYSRPGVKGREIFGGLVPWGEVWRTGANESTLFELSHDAEINGQKLAAGEYALFTIPNKESWAVIFNRQAEQWGSTNYQKDQDALRLDIAPIAKKSFAERFEIRVVDVDETSAKIELRWLEIAVPFTVTFPTRELALAQAKEFAARATKEDARTVANWATWALQNDAAAEGATWMAKVAAENDVYRYHALNARLLAKTGKIAEAKAAAEKALARAAGEDAKTPGVTADSEKLKQELAAWK